MVTRRRFFAMVWRINGMLILIAGLIAIGFLAFAAWQVYRDITRTRQASNVVNVAEEQIDSSKTRLGNFERVEGSTVLRASLFVEQQYAFGSGSKATSSTQNYLFYNFSSGDSYWLVPGNRGLFLSTHEIPAHNYSERRTPVLAFLYEYVAADTNGDKRLTVDDLKTIAISDATGARFGRLLENIEEFKGSELAEGGSLVVLYTSSSTLKAARVDIQQQKVLQDAPLKPVAKDPRK